MVDNSFQIDDGFALTDQDGLHGGVEHYRGCHRGRDPPTQDPADAAIASVHSACQRSLFGLVGTTVAGRRTALLYQRGAKYQCQPTGCVDSLFRQHRCRPRAKRHPTVANATTAANIAVSCHHRIRTVFGGGPLFTKTGQ